MKNVKIYPICIVVLLVFSMAIGTAIGSQKITIYGDAISPGSFMADDGRIYRITDKNIGKQLLLISDHWASKVKVTGTVQHMDGRWTMNVDAFEKYSHGYCYPGSCAKMKSDTPIRMN